MLLQNHKLVLMLVSLVVIVASIDTAFVIAYDFGDSDYSEYSKPNGILMHTIRTALHGINSQACGLFALVSARCVDAVSGIGRESLCEKVRMWASVYIIGFTKHYVRMCVYVFFFCVIS